MQEMRRKIDQSRHRLRKHRSRTLQWLEIIGMGAIAVFFLTVGATLVWASFVPIPSINNFQNRQVAQSTKIYDRTGNIVLYDVHGQVRRTSVPLDAISTDIQNATIAVEDSTFYQNSGFRPLALARALWIDITTGSYAQGGSTITQQVVKNALLTQDKTVMRKIKEIILALRLTRAYPKEQILNAYLNESPYGGTVYGVQEASMYFFGIDARDVNLAQAAYIAAIPKAPTYYSPYGNHKEDLEARKNFVLARMNELGYITDERYQQALKEVVSFKHETQTGIKAPHFVFYIKEYLENKYGVDAVESGGLRVTTTLDYDLQQQAEGILAQYAPSMQTNFNASNEGLVVIDPTTGHIVAMIGSRGYFDTTIDGQYNVTLAKRQPGSAFKPIVYATAFTKGYTPSTVVFDLQTQFSTRCSASDYTNNTPPCYSPGNYDNIFHGPISLRNALAQSLNVPAVKVLYLAGIKDSMKMARDFGITTFGDPSRYGLALVLGGGEVSLLELTGAYGVFAGDGIKNTTTGILKVQDKNGKTLEEYEQKPERVIEQEVARQISSILSDNVARTPEFGANGPLTFPGNNVADKTGTTNDSRDAWVVGYTPNIVVGAWAGNNDNSPMQKKISAFILAPMWHDVMLAAMQKYPSAESFTPPSPDASEHSLPPVLTGNWNSNPSQGTHEILYWVNKDAPRSGAPTNPWLDPQFSRWEYPVKQWAGQIQDTTSAVESSVGTKQNIRGAGSIQITTPQQGTFVPHSQLLTISASVSDPHAIESVVYIINGTPVATATIPPYTASILPTVRGLVTLTAFARNKDDTTASHSISITIQ